MLEKFERAIKKKYRFESFRGLLNVEDLYDLPLTSTGPCLDDVARRLNKAINEHQESFVVKSVSINKELQDKFDIVKYIIDIKLAEADKRKKSAERKALREKLLTAIAEKEDASLMTKSVASLRKMVDELTDDEE